VNRLTPPPTTNVFVGGGLAHTPTKGFQTGHHVSYPSWDAPSSTTLGTGSPASRTQGGGGNELLFHPTLVYSPGRDLLFFGIVSVPLGRDFRDQAAQDRFRLGAGVLYSW
jgi:hypothetical protein